MKLGLHCLKALAMVFITYVLELIFWPTLKLCYKCISYRLDTAQDNGWNIAKC